MGDLHPVLQAVAALVPPAGVAFLFWLAIRSIISADRSERAALARMDAEDRRSGVGPVDGADDAGPPTDKDADGI